MVSSLCFHPTRCAELELELDGIRQTTNRCIFFETLAEGNTLQSKQNTRYQSLAIHQHPRQVLLQKCQLSACVCEETLKTVLSYSTRLLCYIPPTINLQPFCAFSVTVITTTAGSISAGGTKCIAAYRIDMEQLPRWSTSVAQSGHRLPPTSVRAGVL